MAKVFLGVKKYTQLYVAPGGTGDGSINDPFGTIEEARDAIRSMQPLIRKVVVYLRGGDYQVAATVEFDLRDSGTLRYPIEYRSYPGERAVVRGTIDINSGWSQTPGKSYWQVSVTGQAKFRTLIVNGERRQRARWPDVNDYHVMETYPEDPAYNYDYIIADTSKIEPVFNANDEPEFIAYQNSFVVQRHKVADPSNPVQNGNIAPLGAPVLLPFNKLPHYDRYYWENAIGFLTVAGEWYYDNTAEILYYWPMAGETPNDPSMAVEVPVVDTILSANGVEADLPALNTDCTLSCWLRTSFVDAGDPSDSDYWKKGLLQNFAVTSSGISIGLVQRTIGGATYQGVIEARYANKYVYDIKHLDLNDGNWHHVSAAFDKVGNVVRIYVDGDESDSYIDRDNNATNVIDGTKNIKTLPPWVGSDIPNYPWNSTAYGSTHWIGEIDDVVISSGAIDSASVATEIKNKDYSSIDRVMHLPFAFDGDWSFACDTVAAIQTRELWTNNVNDVYDSEPHFIDGGPDHNPCITLDGFSDMLTFNKQPGEFIGHLKFRDITFKGADWPELPDSGWSEDPTDHAMPIYGLIDLKYATDIEIRDCEIHAAGGHGVQLHTCPNVTILGNKIYDIGCNGIIAIGIDKVINEISWAGTKCNSNEIYTVGDVHPGDGSGIQIHYATEIQINDNLIYDCHRCGIKINNENSALFYQRKNVEIARNRVRDCLLTTGDGGLIMVNGEITNGVIHHNNIKNAIAYPDVTDFYRPDDVNNFVNLRGFYCDAGSMGWVVEYNEAHNCDSECFFGNQIGPDTYIRNNIFTYPGNVDGACLCLNISNERNIGDGEVGVTKDRAIGSVAKNNVYYDSTVSKSCWRIRCAEGTNYIEALYKGDGEVPDGQYYPLGDLNINSYWPNIMSHWVSKTLPSTAYMYPDAVGVTGYAFTTFGMEESSITVDPQFTSYPEDCTVNNSEILALGFVNFDVPSF